MFGGILSNFTGGAQRRANRKAQATQKEYLGQGQGALDQYFGQAHDYIDPYYQQGLDSSQFYNDLLAGDQGAIDQFRNNPLFNDPERLQQSAAFRQLNARGLGGSGLAALTAGRVADENTFRNLGLFADRANQGFQAAGAASGLAANQGTAKANLFQNAGNNIAGLQNQMGQTYNTGMNNLLGIAGVGLQATGAGGLWGKKGLFG